MFEIPLYGILSYLLLAINLWLAYKLEKQRLVSPYLVVAVFISITLWNLPLFTIFVLGNHPWPVLALIPQEDFFIGYALELIVTSLLLGITLVGFSHFRRPVPSTATLWDSGNFSIVALGALCLIVMMVRAKTDVGDYITGNALQMETDIADQAQSAATSLVTGLALALSILMTNLRLRSRPAQKLLWTMSWLTIGIYTAHGVLIKSFRGAILLPPAVYLVNRFDRLGGIPWRRLVVFIVVCTAVTPFALYAVSQLRARGGQYSVEDVASEAGDFFGEKLLEAATLIAREVHVKCDCVSTGILLLQSESPGAGGWMPIVSSFGSLVPRVLWPSKPWPGSRDGTVAGHPSRVIAALAGGGEAFMVGAGIAHVAVWQLGYLLGILLTVVLGAARLWIINALLVSQSLYLRAIGLSMLAPPLFHLTLTTPDIVVQDFGRMILLVTPYLFVRLFTRSGTRDAKRHTSRSAAGKPSWQSSHPLAGS